MNYKKYIPATLKLNLRLAQRLISYSKKGILKKMPNPVVGSQPFEFDTWLSQPIQKSYLYENKIHNLKIGADKINQYVLNSGSILSVMLALGKPSAKNNYKIGRNIIGGELKEDFGGGLCQLSSAIYLISLRSGLKILERHNHSTDIYTDDNRFTPLGTDATTVYGYKDLLILNPYPFDVQFHLEVVKDEFVVTLKSREKIIPTTLEFLSEKQGDKVVATVIINKKDKIISSYNLP